MTEAVIHIGFCKTGTSSLQAALSSDVLNGTPYEYCAIRRDGSVLCGQALAQRARKNTTGYVTSNGLLDCIDHDLVRTSLAAIRERGKIPILSQECWSYLGNVFRERSLLERWGISNAHLIAYVRPQVEFLNSGWWQWWAWSGMFRQPADIVGKFGVGFMLWATYLKPWLSIVKRPSVRLHGQDTIGDFFSVLGLDNPIVNAPRKNTGISRELVQLYKAVPELRTEHGEKTHSVLDAVFNGGHGAILDSVLSPLLNGGSTPWLVSPDLARRVVDQCREDNIELRAYLSPNQQDQMTEDQHWWSAECYGEAKDVELLKLSDAITILSKIVPEWVTLRRKILALEITHEERIEKAAERLVAIARRTERSVKIGVILLGMVLAVAIAILLKMF
jgi:hypothetical protein